MPKKSKLLNTIGEHFSDIEIDVKQIPISELKNLTICMKDLTDYRNNASYKLLENSVMITFIGLLADCNEWTEIYDFLILHYDWFESFLDFSYGIPSLSTLKRNIAIIDTEELEQICVNYMINKIKDYEKMFNIESNNEKDIIAYDGKKCNGSSVVDGSNGEKLPTNAMSAYNVDKDLCLATKFIGDKTNEIPTGPELIKLLDLTNTISTFDALNTQKKTIQAIVDKGGDYVGALKGNQHNFYDDVKTAFEDSKFIEIAQKKSSYETTEKAHNQIEKRTYVMTEDIKWLSTEKWAKIKSIGFCKKETIKNDKVTIEIRYYITSLGVDEIKDFSRAIRSEWGIENNLHWHLDYTFKEDYNKTCTKNAQANLNILRKQALNLIKLVKPLYNNFSLKRIRKRIGQNFEQEINTIFSYLSIDELKKNIQKFKKQ